MPAREKIREAEREAGEKGHRLSEFRESRVDGFHIAFCETCRRTAIISGSGAVFGNALRFRCFEKERVFSPETVFRAALLHVMENRGIDTGMCFRFSECSFEGMEPGCSLCKRALPFTRLDPGFRVTSPSATSLKSYYEAMDNVDLDAAAAIDTLMEYARDNKIDLEGMPKGGVVFDSAA